jgi:uncharacterized protein YdaU (DUF1376 family)
MLDVYWLNDAKGLPDNDEDLARMTRVDVNVFKLLKRRVISFFVVSGGVLRNAKADKIYLEALGAMEAASDRAKAGADARWKDKSTSNAQALPEQSSSPVQPSKPVIPSSTPPTGLVVQAHAGLFSGQEDL